MNRPMSGPIEDTINADAVQMALQPIVDMRTGKVLGQEALARFPELNMGPQEVFQEAKIAGLEIRLDFACLRAALGLLAEIPEDQYLSVNVLPVTLADEGWRQFFVSDHETLKLLTASMNRHRSESAVLWEISETRDLNFAHIRSAVSELRQYWRIGINDVGTEGSGLYRIARIRPDMVKLDRSLIHSCDEDASRQWVLEMLSASVPKLPARIVAEGVERQEEADTLIDMRIFFGQGYLFGKPSELGTRG